MGEEALSHDVPGIVMALGLIGAFWLATSNGDTTLESHLISARKKSACSNAWPQLTRPTRSCVRAPGILNRRQ